MSHRPPAAPPSASRRGRRYVATLLLALLAAAAFGTGATGRTAGAEVIDFEGLAEGSIVGTQFQNAGGAGVIIGQGPAGTTAGAPARVVTLPSGARSGSRVVEISECPSSEFAPYGIWGSFPGGGKQLVRLYVGAPAGHAVRDVSLVGVDVSGNEITGVRDTQTVPANDVVGTKLEIADPQGRILYFKLVLQGQQGSPGVIACNSVPRHRIDDLSFDVPDTPQQPSPPPPPQPDFGLVLEPLPFGLSVRRGATSAPAQILVNRVGGSQGPLELVATGLPAGVTANFNRDSISSPKVVKLRISASKTAKAIVGGTFTVTATPTASSGPETRSVTVPFTVVEDYDLAVTGIDVTQGIQRDADLPPRPSGTSSASYAGVRLVRDKKTTVRVFAVVAAPTGATVGGATLLLHGRTKAGKALPGSPLTGTMSPKASLANGPDQVTAAVLKTAQPAFRFTLPPEWTKTGEIQLEAELRPPLVIGSSKAECGAPECLANNGYRLRGIPFVDTGHVDVAALWLRVAGQSFLGFPDEALSAVAQLFPLADGGLHRVDDWQGERDATAVMTAATNAVLAPGQCQPFENPLPGGPSLQNLYAAWCAAAPDPDKWLMGYSTGFSSGEQGCDDEWAEDRHSYCFDAVLGLVDDKVPAGLNGVAGLSKGGRTIGGKGARAVANLRRPLTSVAHELLHGFGRHHASGGCGGGANDQKADPWPDGFGTLQGIGYDHRNASVLYTGNAPAGNGTKGAPPLAWYDFMSYCANVSAEWDAGAWSPWARADSWISPINWELAINTLRSLAAKQAKNSLDSATVLAARQPILSVRGFVDRGVVVLTQIEPRAGTPSPATSGTYRLVLRDRSGGVVSDTPMVVETSEGHGAEATFVAADVPLAGVPAGALPQRLAAAEVVADGTLAGGAVRTANPPVVRLVGAPKQGARVSGSGTTTVRWSARDADGGALRAFVEYSTDDGRSWEALWAGPSRGVARIPSRLLSGSAQARLRVRVSDGFGQGVATSPRFVVVGRAPTVRILAPTKGARVQAGERLSLVATAEDDRGRRLAAPRLAWYAGERRLARGASVSIAGLAPGTHRLRAEARDARGRIGSAAVSVRVLPAAPQLLVRRTPAFVRPAAQRIRLTLSASLASTVTVAGTGLRATRIPGLVGLRPRAVTVAVRPGKTPLRIVLRARAHGRASSVILILPRS